MLILKPDTDEREREKGLFCRRKKKNAGNLYKQGRNGKRRIEHIEKKPTAHAHGGKYD